MNFQDIFRNFIGINPSTRPPFYEEGPDNSDSPPFFHGMDDMMGEMEEMIRNFDEIFNTMGFGQIPQGHNHGFVFKVPGIEGDQDTSAPRDHMLKEPGPSEPNYSPPQKDWGLIPTLPSNIVKKDMDLDGQVTKEDLSALFGNPETPKRAEILPQPHTYYKSVTIRTVRTPDGKMKQEKTVRDGSGKEETTVTHTHDDTQHFERHWNFTNTFTPKLFQDEERQNIEPLKENLDENKNSIFQNLFGSFFKDGKS